MEKKNKTTLWLIFIFFLIFLLSYQISKKAELYKNYLKEFLDPKLFAIIQVLGDADRSSKKINNDYNVLFLPKTQLINLNLIKINLNKNFTYPHISGYVDHLKVKVNQTFYIDTYNNNIVFLTKNGKLFFSDYEAILQNNKLKKINLNFNLVTALDLLIDKNIIFIVGTINENKCAYLVLYKAEITDLENLEFEKIFKSNECMNIIQSARLAKLKDKDFLLMSAAADIFTNNEIDDKPQRNNSIYGKILEIDLKSYNYKIFSKGHRNILGLYVDEEVILSTENGPRGGDEINKIIFNGNYGWPIVSFGEKYYSDNGYVDHVDNDYGFNEPIYSFIPSVGISQIVKVDKNFSKKWKDNFLFASLNGNHLYRIRFDKKYEKVFFIENIFIGDRIRDIVYFKNKNVFLLALEKSGSIGILKP